MDRFLISSKNQEQKSKTKNKVKLVIKEKDTSCKSIDEKWEKELETYKSKDDSLYTYIEKHNEKEKIAYFIAKEHLKSSFNISRSNGYIEHLYVNNGK